MATPTPINFATPAPSNGNGKAEGPTADNPLRGLEHLSKVAVLGRDALLALADAPTLYIWDGIALVGIIVVIAGGVGSGKTTLLFLVLIARANTGAAIKVLGREVTPAPPDTYVVLIEGEHSESSAARKLVKSCRLLGVEESALDRIIIVARKDARIGSPVWQDVEKLIAAGLVSDIALDTLARVAPGDANDEREQVQIFNLIATAIDRSPSVATRPVVWPVAHTRKDAGDDLDGVSGSAQRTGQADTVLMVRAEKRDGKVISSRVTFAKLREEPDDYPGPVEFTVTKDKLVESCAPTEDKRPLEERIIERLKLGAETKSALKRKLGRSDADIEEAFSSLFAAHRITSTTVTVKGIERKAFCLREAS
jgi:hypothetical protein